MKRFISSFALSILLAAGAIAQDTHNYQWNSNNNDNRISVVVKGEIEFASDRLGVTVAGGASATQPKKPASKRTGGTQGTLL